MLVSSPQKTFYIETFGCQMNFHDSEKVVGTLISEGYAQVQREEDADLIVYNTCSIRDKAEQKVFHRLADFKKLHKEGKRFAVLGCVAQQEGEKILDRLQHLLHPRQGGAEGLPSPGRFQEAAQGREALRRSWLRRPAGGREDLRSSTTPAPSATRRSRRSSIAWPISRSCTRKGSASPFLAASPSRRARRSSNAHPMFLSSPGQLRTATCRPC